MRRNPVLDAVDEELARRPSLMVDLKVRACRADRDGKKTCRTIKTRGKIDTGAHNTYLPKKLVRKLRPKRTGRRKATGITGHATTTEYGGVTLKFPNRPLRDVPLLKRLALAFPDPNINYVLLGTDVMAGGDDPKAAMKLEYDGATGSFHLRQSKTKPARRT